MPSPVRRPSALALVALAAALAGPLRGEEPLPPEALDAFRTASAAAAERLAAADDAERGAARGALGELVGRFAPRVADLGARVEGLVARDVRGELDPEEVAELRAAEHRHSLGELLLAEAEAELARGWGADDPERGRLLAAALDRYGRARDGAVAEGVFLYACVGRVEVLLDVGEVEEAARGAEELTWIPRPPAGAGPEAASLAQEVCLRGHLLRARALGRAGRSAEALAALEALADAEAAGEWTAHPLATPLRCERARLLGRVDRAAAGARILYAIVLEARRAPPAERLAGLDMAPSGAVACRALSELADQSGARFGPGPQHCAGLGYVLRGEPARAAVAFKEVLTAARSPAQREAWLPRAVKELGELLFRQERYLEAAIAYDALLRALPGHAAAPRAGRYARSAARRAVAQLGDPGDGPLAAFLAEVEARAERVGGADLAARYALEDAVALHREGRWREAAARYREVPPGVDGHARALASAAACLLAAARAEGDAALRAEARAAAVDALAAAGEDPSTQALARLTLGRVELAAGRPGAALEALAWFDDPSAGEGGARLRARARSAQARAHLDRGEAGDLAAAEGRFAAVDVAEADPDVVGPFALRLARACRAAAGEAAGREAERELRGRAAAYAHRWSAVADRAGWSADAWLWAGAVLFEGGRLEEAAALLEGALDRFPLPVEDQGEASRLSAALGRAERDLGYALLGLGRVGEARRRLARARDAVVLRDRHGRPLRRGRLVGEAVGPDGARRLRLVDGATGEELVCVEVERSRPGALERSVVVGPDRARAWTPRDVRTLDLEGRGDLLVADGLARALWASWEAEGDPALLVGELAGALNALRGALKALEPAAYARLAGRYPLPTADLERRRWEADVRYLELKLAREDWAGVLSDVATAKELGKLRRAPPDLRARVAAIEERARARAR